MLLLSGLSTAYAGQLQYCSSLSHVESALFDRNRSSRTASHEERSGALRSGSQPVAGQLLYLIPLALLVKSAVRDCFSVSGQHSSTTTRSGNLHPRPKGTGLSTRASRWGVVLHLRGVRLSGLSASLWGEQVISYVGSGGWANRGCTPGVSHRISRVIPRILRRDQRPRS